MDSDKIELMLLASIIIAILVKLVFFSLIPKRKAKFFFRSFIKWYKMAYMIEDLDENVESFMTTSNYCNLVLWIGSLVLLYLVVFFLIFPEGI